jgi:hypothetical protein
MLVMVESSFEAGTTLGDMLMAFNTAAVYAYQGNRSQNYMIGIRASLE